MIGRLLDAVRRLRPWQAALVAYLVLVPVSWLLWTWSVPERRTGSHLPFALLIGPLAAAALAAGSYLLFRDRSA
jgi:hypothetical protein